MKIEAGKYYRTRGGAKAFVAGENPFCDKDNIYYLVGFIDKRGSSTWRSDGIWSDSSNGHSCDLVKEWKEPRTMECYVLMVQDKDGGVCLSLDARDRHVLGGTTVTVTEGEFDE